MSRPTKQGLDYFPMDVDLDNKFELIEAKHGLKGFAVIIKLYQEIYREGYFLKWDEEKALIFGKKNGLSIAEVDAILTDCFHYGIFEKRIFSRYKVLTSAGIQKRFVSAISRRKEVKFCKSLMLTDVNPLVNVNINWVNASNKAQSKVKGKGKESKGERKAVTPPDFLLKIIDQFKQAHGSYEVIDLDSELSATEAILQFYKAKYPDSTDEITLEGLRDLFDKCVKVKDEFMRHKMSLPYLYKNWNEITHKIYH